jgi:hypothetical protein
MQFVVLTSRIPGKKILDPGSASKKVFLTLEILSRMFIPDPDIDGLPIPDPGSRGKKGTGSEFATPVDTF